MAIQIANVGVVAKIERLARATGLGKTASVEVAVDRFLAELAPADVSDPWRGLDAIVDQLQRIPPRADAFEAVEYDEQGLPR